MFKNLTAIIAGSLIALSAGPAFAQSQNVPEGLDALMNLLMPKTIFVTSTTDHTGDLGGLAGADAICQGLADAPGSIVPEGEYVAVLSVIGVNASGRITPSSGPYIRPDGAPVASDFGALFAAFDAGGLDRTRDLLNPVIINELGTVSDVFVWAATSGSGVADGPDCLGWLSGDGGEAGTGGSSNSVAAQWLDFFLAPCDAPGRSLYCVGL